MKEIRVLVVVFHDALRSALVGLLSSAPGLVLVSRCGDEERILDLSTSLHPDVLLLDFASFTAAVGCAEHDQKSQCQH